MLVGTDIVGTGLTVMVKVVLGPVQPATVAVTVMVEVIGLAVLFVATNVGNDPDPLAPNPIAVFELVHVNVPPVGVLLNAVDGTLAPEHWLIGVIALTVGRGLIVIVKVIGVPVHPFLVGVTVIVAEIGVDPVFVAVNVGKLPLPLAPKPIDVLEFVQVNVVPA